MPVPAWLLKRGGRCPCRKAHPCRSGCVVVLVEDAAQAVASSYVEAVDLLGIGDGCGEGVQWAGVGDALMRPMLVVELLELAESVEKVPVVPDECAVQQFSSAGLHQAFHDRVHARYAYAAEDHLYAGVGENGVEECGNFPSRSRIRNRAR